MKWLHTIIGILAIISSGNALVSDGYSQHFSQIYYKSDNYSELTVDNNDIFTEGYISYNVDPTFNSEQSGDSHKQNQNDDLLRWDKRRDDFNSELKRVLYKRIFLESAPNRKVVSTYKLGMFPYNNVVKISSGCTGTLLTPKHVLTAAHCVHDGKEFKDNMEMLKVEVADRIGYRIHYIVKINVPVLWMKTQMLPEIGRGAFDYAILQLNLPVSGREKFMPLALPTLKALDSSLKFLGYKLGRAPALWLSKCDTDAGMDVMGGNVALRKCESIPGNSGAAVFVNSPMEGSKIIGLLSNTIVTSGGGLSPQSTEYEAMMLLTLPKCLDICAMIHPEGDKYDVCKMVKRNNIEYLEVGATRIMPFFG